MKKTISLLLAIALMFQVPANCAEQPSNSSGRGCASCVGANQATSSLSWTIGAAGLAVFATVTILIMLNASKAPTSFHGT